MEFKTFITIPIYQYRIFVIFTSDLDETVKNLKNKGLMRKESNINDRNTGAFHLRFDDENFSYLIFKMNADSIQVTHECYHAVSTMFKWIGATYEEELFAYHLGYLAGEVTAIQSKAIKKYDKILDKSEKIVL